ncbi:SYF2 splicing factor [Plectosphaerella plurivora]|uniref:Pre-mRNA-splicing factor SYF2 n=1 Tax=Plectosphaerella plurivora TaxID=936078 RepID=A0A9P9AEQ6_9PEZI|nr:SYF2 splicing factor [Plectosphaerella plurivora]
MPPAAKKRKTRSSAVEDAPAADIEVLAPEPAPATIPSPEPEASAPAPAPAVEPTPVESESKPAPSTTEASASAAAKTQDRLARFKALQARAKSSSDQNLKEAARESQRLEVDPSQLTALHRKQAIASHKLLKADIEDSGGDFERQRAWDWTIDESEQWDKRLKRKAAHRDNTAFQSYHAESNKIYKAQLRNIEPDLAAYERDKMAAIERSAASGGLDIVETEDGELIAVDKDGSFYSTADSTSFAQNKPAKDNIDRLVADMRRAEDNRQKKRRERMAKDGAEDGDVTYINEKNKQFNQKLSRFYNKYTQEIRDSFERGTMI